LVDSYCITSAIPRPGLKCPRVTANGERVFFLGVMKLFWNYIRVMVAQVFGKNIY